MVDVSRFPVQLQFLKPLIEKWAESDDVAREEMITEAETVELRELWDAVSPYFNDINDYLDETGPDPDEDACELGTLAECACEVQFELERRGGDV